MFQLLSFDELSLEVHGSTGMRATTGCGDTFRVKCLADGDEAFQATWHLT
jgi:hypothetical protein